MRTLKAESGWAWDGWGVSSVTRLGGVVWMGVYLVCVSVWLLHLAVLAPCREGKIPMGIKEAKACLANAQ